MGEFNRNLTREEMDLLTACQSEEDWNSACEAIKIVRGGAYPPDWYSRVLGNGLMDNIVGRWGASSALKVAPIDDKEQAELGLRPTDPAPANDGEVCPDCGEVHGKGGPTEEEMMRLLIKLLVGTGHARMIRTDKDPRTMTQEELREAIANSEDVPIEDLDKYENVVIGTPRKRGDGGHQN